MACVIWQLLDRPLILINIVAQAYLRVDIVTEQVNISLVFGTSVKRWKFEKCLLNGPIIINMNRVLEHVVNEVGVWFNELVECLQDLEILLLFLVE